VKRQMTQIRSSSTFQNRNGLHNSFMLYGVLGTGKTLLIEALAYEAHEKVGFSLMAHAGMLLSKYFCQLEKKVNALFNVAKNNSPSIIFIDEVRRILSKRDDESSECSNRVSVPHDVMEGRWGSFIRWSN
jgi:SpoVK/Ycf46/Vps4 family AAA+-type ATPase